MIICPSTRPLHFLFGLTASSERAGPPPGCVFRAFHALRFKHIFHRETQSRTCEEHNDENDKRQRQMALMAGILFTATSVLLGISTFVSSARIYPPNEGKIWNTREACLGLFLGSFDFVHSVCVTEPQSRCPVYVIAQRPALGDGRKKAKFSTNVLYSLLKKTIDITKCSVRVC